MHYVMIQGCVNVRTIIVCTLIFHHQSSVWWDRIVMDTFQHQDWVENFLMSKERFIYLCDKLRPVISCQDTRFRKCISTEKRVALTLWCLATPTEYRTLAHLFGIARSTVCMIVHTNLQGNCRYSHERIYFFSNWTRSETYR